MKFGDLLLLIPGTRSTNSLKICPELIVKLIAISLSQVLHL